MESSLRVVNNPIKLKAMEDAKAMQTTVLEACGKAGQKVPKYALVELIGKGSYGRVYKSKDMVTAEIVAIKIIDIDAADTANPGLDTFNDFRKEVQALQTLRDQGAKNINHVIDVLSVGKTMWMITEHCGGGSVATLMKPTAPGGLQERWIIPIIREVAEAIKWVHMAGIIHRDIKCANVLVTEEGRVQLCDFGVAGVIETKVDKRTTIIGTPHWMPPELFGNSAVYGPEVDIWAFGAMMFEIATGAPPFAAERIVDFRQLGDAVRSREPRLQGDRYSSNLKAIVAYCLQGNPSARPTIESLQRHAYIQNTTAQYPTTSLSHLVRAFVLWEGDGGNRKSLFMPGGAQGPNQVPSTAMSDDEWNFSISESLNQQVRRQSTIQDFYDAYGRGATFDADISTMEATARPATTTPSRRRPPPKALAPLKAPIEKLFDVDAQTSYKDASDIHYNRALPPPTAAQSDLPLRTDSVQNTIRDTMIDLGEMDPETGLSSFPDQTLRAPHHSRDSSFDQVNDGRSSFDSSTGKEGPEVNHNRRTQDWKFPTMTPDTSDEMEAFRFPMHDLPRPELVPAPGGRPALIHHPTEPIGGFSGMVTPTSTDRMSMRTSLIDLDLSLPEEDRPMPNRAMVSRPSTAYSDAGSVVSEADTTASGYHDAFELERHASLYQPIPASINTASQPYRNGSVTQDTPTSDPSDPSSASDVETPAFDPAEYTPRFTSLAGYVPSTQRGRAIGSLSSLGSHMSINTDSSASHSHSGSGSMSASYNGDSSSSYATSFGMAAPPSQRVLGGRATNEEIGHELTRMLSDLHTSLRNFGDTYGWARDSQMRGRTRVATRAPVGDGGASVARGHRRPTRSGNTSVSSNSSTVGLGLAGASGLSTVSNATDNVVMGQNVGTTANTLQSQGQTQLPASVQATSGT